MFERKVERRILTISTSKQEVLSLNATAGETENPARRKKCELFETIDWYRSNWMNGSETQGLEAWIGFLIGGNILGEVIPTLRGNDGTATLAGFFVLGILILQVGRIPFSHFRPGSFGVSVAPSNGIIPVLSHARRLKKGPPFPPLPARSHPRLSGALSLAASITQGQSGLSLPSNSPLPPFPLLGLSVSQPQRTYSISSLGFRRRSNLPTSTMSDKMESQGNDLLGWGVVHPPLLSLSPFDRSA